MRACGTDSDAFEWTQLEALYGNAEFTSLMERARALLRTDMSEFERMLDARAYWSASQRLHRIKGTASFFSCDEEALAALHAAEKALALADPKFIDLTLPRALRAMQALAAAFEARRVRG
jgi:hypothetical protein